MAKMFFYNPRKIDNHNKGKYYDVVARVKLCFELDALVLREISIFV